MDIGNSWDKTINLALPSKKSYLKVFAMTESIPPWRNTPVASKFHTPGFWLDKITIAEKSHKDFYSIEMSTPTKRCEPDASLSRVKKTHQTRKFYAGLGIQCVMSSGQEKPLLKCQLVRTDYGGKTPLCVNTSTSTHQELIAKWRLIGHSVIDGPIGVDEIIRQQLQRPADKPLGGM